ncbi:MAG: hypothetical protein HQK96_19260 [Nitrospirae bacterium]|nr:hypothetical protein [Nitrospirota bacterium]
MTYISTVPILLRTHKGKVRVEKDTPFEVDSIDTMDKYIASGKIRIWDNKPTTPPIANCFQRAAHN